MSFAQTIRREPLLHFLLIALLLFAADAFFSGDQRQVIQVDANTLDFLVKQRSELLMRELSEEERKSLLNNYIDDEVLLREAYLLGLDKDARMRSQLIKKMRIMLAVELPRPTEADLRAYLDANRERYRLPPRISFLHVFYNTADAVPQGLRAKLNATAINADAKLLNTGQLDPLLGRAPKQRSELELRAYIGTKTAAEIFTIDDDKWHGPLRSPRGIHFVRITQQLPMQQFKFESIIDYLVPGWQLHRQKEEMADKVAEFRDKYRVITPTGEPAS
ncbi:MAG: peptidyl-prolyl cis-trans isomerase [Gammaproteobacteria bacterium]|nr:peptidyl-prolyl cis-trans isomerase [Gammaproteobacteria bacterium]